MTLNVPALLLRAHPVIQRDCRQARIRNRNTQPSLNQIELLKIPVESFEQLPKHAPSRLLPRYRPQGKRTHSRYNDT